MYGPIYGDVTLSGAFLEARRKLHLTPMRRVMRELTRRGVDVSSLRALEMFGGNGRGHTVDYAPYVASTEVWEIDPAFAPVLRQNLPEATVKIVDSFAEIEVSQNKFDLVLVDPPYEMFGGHCEHFDIFPGVFRILKPFSILVLCNVRLNVVMSTRYSDRHLEIRKSFYEVDDPTRIPLDQMLKIYNQLFLRHGYESKWWVLQDRNLMYRLRRNSIDRVCYLALAIQRKNTGFQEEPQV
jgi:hypothetical protein